MTAPRSGTYEIRDGKIVMFREQRCDECDGSGSVNSLSGYAQRECQECSGAGFVLVEEDDRPVCRYCDHLPDAAHVCDNCRYDAAAELEAQREY